MELSWNCDTDALWSDIVFNQLSAGSSCNYQVQIISNPVAALFLIFLKNEIIDSDTWYQT